MTLLLSVLTDNAVLQASDRRVTWLEADGSTRPIDDNRNKAVFFGKRMVLTYTGLANLGPRRQRTDDWLAQMLHDALNPQRDQAGLLDFLATAATERLRHRLYARLASEQRRHEFVACGWARFPDSGLKIFRPYLAVVSNFRDDVYEALPEPQSDFKMRFGQLSQADDYQLFIAGQGLDLAHEQRLRADIAATGGDLEAIASLLVHHIREAAKYNVAIGKGISLSVLPRAAIVEGDDSSLLIMGGPIDKVPTFLNVPADSGEAKRYGPILVSPAGGVISGLTGGPIAS